jgi:hypothetical protein
MALMQLVYVSSATDPFSKEDLLALLERSRPRNEALGVTGLLLYKDGNIMQVLEGDEGVLEALYLRIQADPRHTGVILLYLSPLASRDFPDWSMAFHDLQDPGLRFLPGFSEFLNQPFDPAVFENEPSRARRLVALFRANMR